MSRAHLPEVDVTTAMPVLQLPGMPLQEAESDAEDEAEEDGQLSEPMASKSSQEQPLLAFSKLKQ